MLFIYSLLPLSLAPALLHLFLAASASASPLSALSDPSPSSPPPPQVSTNPPQVLNSTIPRHIIALKPNAVEPSEDGRRKFLRKVLGPDFDLDAGLNESLLLFWNKDTFDGFSGRFVERDLLLLRRRSEVEFVEPDIEITTAAATKQLNAPWNIARLTSGSGSFANLDPNGGFAYVFNPGNFSTTAYVIDTGCSVTDTENIGRSIFIGSFGPNPLFEPGNEHGTIMNTVIAGGRFGVAKNATINCIKVSKDRHAKADTSDFISGIDLALGRARNDPTQRPSVIVAAWESQPNRPLDAAVSNVIKQGFPVIVAAGNDGINANEVSPARVSGAITVGATDMNDDFVSNSNFGPNVTILAPGSGVRFFQSQLDLTLEAVSGTSFAAAHVAGLSLLLMSQDGKQLDSTALTERLTSLALKGVITDVPGGTPNLLLSSDLRA